MEKKLVSAIITTHNRQDLLVRAVKSVFDQTYQNLELIVVDDASDKRADKLFKNFHLQYIYIPQEESKGGNHARNLGILAAKGEYVAFLDDDDYWLPTKIEKQVALIEEKHCGLVYCGRIKEIHRDGKITNSIDIRNMEGDMRKIVLEKVPTTSSSMLINRNLLIENGMFDENLRFWQDYELLITMSKVTPFYRVPEALTVYLVNVDDNQRISNKYFGWKDAVKYIQKKHKDLYSNLSFKESIRAKILIWTSARHRSKKAGLNYRYHYYNMMTKIANTFLKFIRN